MRRLRGPREVDLSFDVGGLTNLAEDVDEEDRKDRCDRCYGRRGVRLLGFGLRSRRLGLDKDESAVLLAEEEKLEEAGSVGRELMGVER